MTSPRGALAPETPGLACRRIASDIVFGVLRRHRPLDEQLDGNEAHPGLSTLDDRDRALVRKLAATVLRRLGSLRAVLAATLERGLPENAPWIEAVLLIGAVQTLWLDVPDHAAVDLAVRLVRADRRGGPYAGLVNAVLRRIAREGAAMLAERDPVALDTPRWLMDRWARHFGEPTARAIAAMHACEPPLDLTARSDPQLWAAKLNGTVMATGTVRTFAPGRISQLPGYEEGAWWVQDAAASLPARLFGDLAGRQAADLCAAPGGKTAQLVLTGAAVTAVDRSIARLARLRANLARLRLRAQIVAADVLAWDGGAFDAVLLDAPCMATGTIRRHPDIPWLKREADLPALASLQGRLLDRAAALLRPGGTLIYCTCSLEPEENEQQVDALLARDRSLRRRPITADEVCGRADWVSPFGDLRTLPCHLAGEEAWTAGLDGFYAARLERASRGRPSGGPGSPAGPRRRSGGAAALTMLTP
jgi:16S rRNA (cytosine967-C5)-methyltransferase